jgi:hypothetical protein
MKTTTTEVPHARPRCRRRLICFAAAILALAGFMRWLFSFASDHTFYGVFIYVPYAALAVSLWAAIKPLEKN